MAELNARIIAKASGTASEEPQASDLEVAELAVNTADGKLFTKHTDGSIVTISGGGGGAVDSVNGQTGVVSLGIQDMDDFELLQDDSGYGTNMGTWSTLSGSIPGADGEWQTFNGEFRLDAHNDAGTNWDAYFTPLIGAGSGSVFVSTDGAAAVEVTFTDVATGSNNGEVYYRLQGASPLPSGSVVNVYQPLGAEPPSLPLVDGDALQWVAADGKFKPVSLDIQNMGDFELNLAFTGTVYRHVLGSYHIDGEYQVNGDGLLIKEYDADGVQSVKPTNGGTMYLSADGISFVAATISGSVGTAGTNPGGTSNTAWNLTFADSSIYSGLGITSGQSLYWSNENPSGTLVPLADGDILQWNDTDQKFKPGQLQLRNSADLDGIALEDGASLIYDAVDGIFKQKQQASDVLSAMAYKFKNTLSGDPSTGHIAINNADPSLATEIRVHKTTTNGVDLTNIFTAGVGTAQGIYIQRKDDASEAHFFRTTGPATDSGAYMTVGVEHVSGTGTFTNNKVMAVGVYAKGESAALAPLSVPSSATDTGTAGDIRYDAGYVYICVAANTWKRAALASW